MQTVELMLNGERIREAVQPRTTLADFLRETGGARSVHLGCEHGVCGACTVVIDGKIARSCIALSVAMNGADIKTLEGLRDDPIIVQLRDSFHKNHALQCGYCTPGMLITARDILLRGGPLTDSEVRTMLAGNICRCTGYAGCVKAIKHAAERLDATHDGALSRKESTATSGR